MVSRRSIFALAAAVGLVAAAPAQAQLAAPFQLIDLASSYDQAVFPGSNAGRYVEYQGSVYFFAAGDWGSGLWKTNGTRTGTSLVAYFSSIADMAVANNLLFISGSTSGEGLELWTYDGFSAQLVKDIRPGTVSSSPGRFFPWTGRLMFSADPDGLGQVLQTSDGTTAGTVALDTYKDPQELVSFNGRVFFTAKVDQLVATETNLWSWSPLTGGQLVESRVVSNLAVLGTTLYVTKRSGTAVTGRFEGELWKTDGTPGAAIQVTSLWTGGDAAVSDKTVLGAEVLFAGCDPATGRNLYRTNGTTVTLVKDFLLPDALQSGVPAPPANSCDIANGPRQLTVINGKMYFETDDGIHGQELWTSDGTTPGTVLLADLDSGLNASDLYINSAACGREACRAVTPSGFFFTARTEYTGRELFFSDGTPSGTARLTDLDSGDRDGVQSNRLLVSGGKVFFTGSNEDANAEPWVLPLTPTLAVADVTVSESAAQATVTVRLLPANPSATVTVHWATANGWASSGSDYTASFGDLTFPPNSGSQTLSVPILEDALREGNEYFSIVLSTAVNAGVGNSTSRVTIRDNEGPFLSVSSPDLDPTEGSGAVFTISLTAPHDNIVTVHYRTVAVTASNSDFTPKLGYDVITFQPTAPTATDPQTATVSVGTAGDSLYEYWWEYFELEIFAASGASITTSRAWASIYDNDGEPDANIGNRTVAEGDVFATHTITLTNASSQPVRMYWSSDGGAGAPADPGPDFRDASGFVVFRPGETTHDVTIEAFEDTIDEPNEVYYVDLDTTTAANTTVVVGRGVGTITDDDTGTLTIGNVTVVEGDAGTVNAVLTLSLSIPYYRDFTVDYATQDTTAIGGVDYTAVSGTLSFPKGSTTQTITVPVLGDVIDEGSETFKVLLSNSTGPGVSDSRGDVTITDDDTTVSVADASANEGNTGTTTLTVTVSTVEAYKTEFSVDYTTLAGGVQPATPGVDYVETTGTVVFPQGTKSRTFTVTVNSDLIDEPAETFLIRLSNSGGPLILDGEAVGTINDNDNATVAINNVTVPEGNSGTADAIFTVSLATPYYRDFTVNWATAAGLTNPATEGVDYLAASGTLTFTAGTTSQTLAVPVVGDVLDEVNETFGVVLSGSTGPTISDSRGDGTITDDDTLTIDVADVKVVEGNSGTTPATFTLTLSADHEQTITVKAATSGGGPTPPAATAGTDFTSLSSTTLTFAAGVNSQTVSVSVTGDPTVEAANESFGLTLSNPTAGAVLARTKALGIILDDDSTRTISMSPLTVSVMEPLSGTVNARFTVTLSADAGLTTTVNYATASGTALAGSDYTATTGTLSFEPGDRTKTIDVPVLSDSLVESTETFTLTLSGPTNGTIGTGAGTATATITDSLSQIPMAFYTITPCRIVDTRTPAPGSPMAGGVARTFPIVGGSCLIPPTARAISFNVTVTGSTSGGNVRLFPGGTPAPTTSSINFTAGQTRANNGIVALGTSGDLGVLLAPAGGAGHVIIDVNGYME